MEFPEDASMEPPRDYSISLEVYFFDVQDTTAIQITLSCLPQRKEVKNGYYRYVVVSPGKCKRAG